MEARFFAKHSVLQWSSQTVRIFILAMLVVLLGESPAFAQPEQSEHESHHPAAAPSTTPSSSMPSSSMPSSNPPISNTPNIPTPEAAAPDAAQMGSPKPEQNPPPSSSSMPSPQTSEPGMMEGMQKMMKDMMAPTKQNGDEGCCGGVGASRKELYPFLMSLPAWTREARLEVERLSQERIHKGTINLQASHDSLSKVLHTSDLKATEQALQQSRDSLGLIASGVAAHRLLIEGAPPQSAAAQWFKHEMNLPPASTTSASDVLHGVTPLHLFAMGLLIAFALAMVLIYFFKMRRAGNLFGRIKSDSESPPPGAAPPLAGRPPPATPADKLTADTKESSI